MEDKINVEKKDCNNSKIEKLVMQFQCPGCVCGGDIGCGSYNYSEQDLRCTGHVIGTVTGLGNKIALGMPKGFNKPGFITGKKIYMRNNIDIRLFPKGNLPEWDNLNVPVWAMVQEGFLFVRTFAPRINMTWVDVIEDGYLSMVPKAINVSDFIDDID